MLLQHRACLCYTLRLQHGVVLQLLDQPSIAAVNHANDAIPDP
jgi:hypothetical protein